jgi:hypothetical protein
MDAALSVKAVAGGIGNAIDMVFKIKRIVSKFLNAHRTPTSATTVPTSFGIIPCTIISRG